MAVPKEPLDALEPAADNTINEVKSQETVSQEKDQEDEPSKGGLGNYFVSVEQSPGLQAELTRHLFTANISIQRPPRLSTLCDRHSGRCCRWCCSTTHDISFWFVDQFIQ
jgi:hypothetical protein